MIQLVPLDAATMPAAKRIVAEQHYLHTEPDVRTMPEGYMVIVHRSISEGGYFTAGFLIFGRPECTRLYPWFGSVEDVASGRAEITRWGVLNLSRVWLDPRVQVGGCYYSPKYLPGFTDRKGQWRSALASVVLDMALGRIGFDYLLRRPPVFVGEPYQIDYVLSYCNTALHRGTIYAASGFELYRTNQEGIQTWRKRLSALSDTEDKAIQRMAEQNPRSQRIRAQSADRSRQLGLGL